MARKYANGSGLQYLVVDSDLPYDSRMSWFDKLSNKVNPEKSIIISEDKKEGVFFMVQEMEALFLKQPECIEAWRMKNNYLRKFPEEDIATHSLIRNKNIEDIAKPSEKLAILIKKYISDGTRSIRYGKLSVAPGLINELTADKLVRADRELSRFKSVVAML